VKFKWMSFRKLDQVVSVRWVALKLPSMDAALVGELMRNSILGEGYL